jgi:hypothetical protein
MIHFSARWSVGADNDARLPRICLPDHARCGLAFLGRGRVEPDSLQLRAGSLPARGQPLHRERFKFYMIGSSGTLVLDVEAVDLREPNSEIHVRASLSAIWHSALRSLFGVPPRALSERGRWDA